MALAAAMKSCLALQRINLNNNQFTSQTMAVLADALRINSGEP